MAVVFIPTPLRKYAGGQTSVTVPGATLRELMRNLEERFPGLRERLISPEDEERIIPGLTAIVDGEPINMGLRTKLDEQTEVHFLPAIAGGADA
jgi:molybdopterin converting factor small subunit